MKKCLVGLIVFLLISIYTAAAEVSQPDLASQAAENVVKMGSTIGASQTKSGYIFTVENMYMDSEVYYFVCSLAKEDGSSFSADEKLDFTMIDLFGEYDLNVLGHSHEQCQVPNASDKKIYFLVTGEATGDREGKYTVQAANLILCETKEELSTLDLATFLRRNPKVTLADNASWISAKASLDKSSKEDPENCEALKNYFDSLQKHYLANEDLDMPIVEADSGHVIIGAGFVDNKLHLITKSDRGALCLDKTEIEFRDDNGNKKDILYKSENYNFAVGDEMEKTYYVFDIADPNELAKCNCYLVTKTKKVIKKGLWEAEIQVDQLAPRTSAITKKINEELPFEEDPQARLKEIILNTCTLELDIENHVDWDKVKTVPVTLNMKDGSTIELDRILKQEETDTGLKKEIYLIPTGLISKDQVVSITILGKTIKIN